MEENKEMCPCTAVAELKTIVEFLTKKTEENERKIEDSQAKLSNDFTKLELITREIENVSKTLNSIQNNFQEYMQRQQEKEEDSSKTFAARVNAVVEEVIRWGIILVLGYIAVKIGIG